MVKREVQPRRGAGGRRGRGLVALLLAGGLVAAGCGSSDDGASSGEGGGGLGTVATTAPQGEPVEGGELRLVLSGNPSSLDPHVGGTGNDHMSLYPIYDRLVNFTPDRIEPLPGLATSWSFPDPQTLVFELQSGVTFQDGTPFDAEAVKYNIERAKTLPRSTVKADLASIDSVEVTSPTQVTLHLNRPDSALILILADRAGMMVSPTAATAKGDDFGTSPVGTGAFSFVEWVPQDHMTLKKNPTYWQDGLPYLDGITFQYMTDAQTSNNALQAGQVDLKLGVDPADAETLEAVGNLEVVSGPSLRFEQCYFNFAEAPFNNLKFRQAVNHALDKEAINTALLFDMGQPAEQPIPPEHWAYQDELPDAYPHDVEKAKQLFAESGEGPDVRAVTYNGPLQARKAELVQAQLKEVGINMTIETLEVAAATKTFFDPGSGGFDIYCAAWTGRPDPNQTMLSMFSSTGYYNAGKYAPGTDALIAAAAVSPDIEERHAAYKPLIQAYYDNALLLPTVYIPSISAMDDSVKGFQPNLYGKPDVTFLWMEQ